VEPNHRRRRDDDRHSHKRGARVKAPTFRNWDYARQDGIIVILSALLLALGHHGRDIPAALGATRHGLGLWSNFGLAMITVLWLMKAGNSHLQRRRSH